MRIGWIEAVGAIQQTLRNADRGDKYPVRPGLRHHHIRLHTIEKVRPLLGHLLNLIRRCRLPQGLQSPIDGFELLLQLLIFLPQHSQLRMRIFVFPKRRDRARHVVRIHLRDKIHLHDHNITIQCRGGLLVEDKHQPGRVGPDFVFGDIHIMNNGDTLKIGGNLLERTSLGAFGGKPDRVFSGVTISHAMLTLGIDDSDFGKRRDSNRTGHKCENHHDRAIGWMRLQKYEKRPVPDESTEHRLPLLSLTRG